jgi:hypothetical protein
MEAKPEVLALVESWLRELCPETLDMKGIHVLARLCELSVFTYKDSGAVRCHPGRQYLAELVGWSVTKVSRFTSKLRDYGVLKKYQPRTFNTQKQQWDTSTNVYAIPLLTPLRIKQLAVTLKLKLGARMYLFPSKKKKEEKESCVQPPRVKHPILQKLLTRFANLGKAPITQREPLPKIVETNPLLKQWFARGERTT